MESIFDMIRDRKRILKIFRYCRHHAVTFSANCEELIFIESTLTLSDMRRIEVSVKTPFEEWRKRPICLVMRVESLSFHPQLALPCQNFTFSFQHKGMSHSFCARLLQFNQRARLAVFALPEGIYKRRLRHAFRIPVDPSDGVQVELNRDTLEVFNLTMDGVGLYIPCISFFRIGQVVPQLLLLIRGERFLATGRVRHISTVAPSECICGMSLEYKDETAMDRIRKFIVEKQLESAGVPARNTSDAQSEIKGSSEPE